MSLVRAFPLHLSVAGKQQPLTPSPPVQTSSAQPPMLTHANRHWSRVILQKRQPFLPSDLHSDPYGEPLLSL